MNLLTERSSKILIFSGLGLLLILTILFLVKSHFFSFEQELDTEKFDHYGGIVGGLVGSIWTLSSIILFYLALIEQKTAVKDQQEAIQINSRALEAQIKALNLQSEELELQRKELVQTRDVFTEQSKTLKLQQFESTFFSMLNLHHQIVNSLDISIHTRKIKQTEVNILHGRDCFVFFYNEFKSLYYSNNIITHNVDELLFLNDCYKAFYGEHQGDLSHYFRNLYNILKFINKRDPENIFFYSNLLRAQLSPFELLLLFYNCVSIYGKFKFKPLIEKYYFLQNIPSSQLIDREKHILLYNDSAFGKPDFEDD